MTGQITFTMIKPDAVSAGNTGAIIKMIEEAGFEIQAMKKTRLSKEVAGNFYAVHQERPFYLESTGAPVTGKFLYQDSLELLTENSQVSQAAEGTIRQLFATSIEANAIHGSDSHENAAIESGFFFSELERY